jgi:hypothetical protein
VPGLHLRQFKNHSLYVPIVKIIFEFHDTGANSA